MAEVISDKLIQRIKERFPAAKAVFDVPPKPSVVFPAAHPEVGDIEIYDDGSELTVVAGHFTHWHASDYDDRKSNDEAEQTIVDNVIGWLERLFADQVVFWGSHKSGGGCYDRELTQNATVERWRPGRPLYVWSGPLGAPPSKTG